MAYGSIFISTLLLSFASTMLLAGLFGAYYGKGRSRSIGFSFAIVALLLIALFSILTWPVVPGVDRVFDPAVVAKSMAAVGAAIIGTLVAAGFFVIFITRS